MRVLHLVKTATGARWALRQIAELRRLGIEVHVCMPAGPLVDHYDRIGTTVHVMQTDIQAYRPWAWPAMFGKFVDLIDRIAPNLIHSHFVGTTATMRLALRHREIPRIFQVPGPLHLEHHLFRHAEIALADARDYWIGCCQWTRDAYLNGGIARRRTFLSYHGTDPDAFQPQASTGFLRQKLGIQGTAVLVGMVAFMYAPKRYLFQSRGIKGHEDLIDAISICRRRGLDVHAVFVGGAWGEADWYEQAVRRYGADRCPKGTHFLGTRQDVRELYREFDLAVHPSHSENVGGALESLLMEVPTIATAVGGFPDLVIPGETGWLVPPHSPLALADAITDITKHRENARHLARNGRRLAGERFDCRRLAKEVATIYHTILHPSPS